MSQVTHVPLEELMVKKRASVDPSKHPDETFDLYSVPAYDSQKPERISGSEIGSSKKAVEAGDVLLSRIVPHIRRAWVVDEASGNRQIGSGEWMIFKGGAIWPKYLRHLLVSDWFHPKLMQTVSGVGGSLLRARPTEVARIEIPLPHKNGKPDLDEQKRIAAILDKADAIRRKRQQALLLTDDFLRSVFLDMFGSEKKPKCERVPLGPLLDFITSGGRGWSKYYAPSGDRFIRSLDVQMNRISDQEPIYVTAPNNAEAKRTRVQEGDVLLTITGSLIGRVSRVPRSLAGSYISQHVAILRPEKSLNPEFLARALSIDEGQRLIKRGQYGQTKPGLNFDQIRGFLIPLPRLEDQLQYLALCEQATNKIIRNASRMISESELLFSSLQQRAFKGEL